MLILEKSISYDPENITFTLRGKQITLAVRPIDNDAIKQIREKAKIYRYAENPETKRQELGSIIDDKAYDLEIWAHIIADIKGVGTAPDKPIPVTKETKSKLIYQKPGEGEPGLWSVVLDASRELARQRHEALEAEIKNS